ncbi:hypothetical protein FG386_001419 [Cryptosporidium ryanae]|uniref:uncharacterized protein n=1 Tax=Cryptosporidium ryanae TaxID=515981 RepID=UPI00351A2599|nr:hypothetical protein FG386_001419 [Cryptosporidium ryanae]
MTSAYIDQNSDFETSIKSLLDMKSLKWIFVGGKGGVGKTTTSCSIASKLAEERRSVLILSTDPAHNLSDAFGQNFSSTPSLVRGYNNLYGMELDSSFEDEIESKLTEDKGFFSKIIPDFLSSFPGIDEALGFATLMQTVRSMPYSVIVFDTAPTGHTLRLLGFPSLLEHFLYKISGFKDNISGAFQLFNSLSGRSIEENNISSKLDELRATTISIREVFQDPLSTSFVCVCIPEFLSVYETERLIQELARQSINCSHIVVNQVMFPVDVPPRIKDVSEDLNNCSNDGYIFRQEYLQDELPSGPEKLRDFAIEVMSNYNHLLNYSKLLHSKYYNRRKMQKKYLKQIVDLYSEDFNISFIPMMSSEVSIETK